MRTKYLILKSLLNIKDYRQTLKTDRFLVSNHKINFMNFMTNYYTNDYRICLRKHLANKFM